MSDAVRYPVEELESFVRQLFVAVGLDEEAAATTARVVVAADLRGRTGHGLLRAPRWIERVMAGGVNTEPHVRIERETPVSALVDGDNGIGPVVMTAATELAIGKAKKTGLSWVGTRNSNHAGAAGVYPAMALEHDLIGLYMAVAAFNTVPPWGGNEPLLGTSPMAVAIPAGSEPPFQLDMATTTTSHGTIRVHALADRPLPEGWVATPDGTPITDPHRASEGFLLPMGGHKGSGLSIMIGLLAGVMNGAAFGRDVVSPSDDKAKATNTGQMLLVARPDMFLDLSDFRRQMDIKLRELRTSGTQSGGPVRLPGARAAELESLQRAQGIPVPGPLLRTLDELAERVGSPMRLR